MKKGGDIIYKVLKGFKKVEDNKLNEIFAAGNASAIGAIAGTITSVASNLTNIADDISDTIIKNKIVSKIDEVKKGEIELGKDGQLRLKWDSLSSDSSLTKSSIIF